jgi:hypothetical protein
MRQRKHISGEDQHHYVFDREQILTGDVTDFVRRYDPAELSDNELRDLFGRLSLELNWDERAVDPFMVLETRRLMRACHQRFQWLGFFLRHDRPFGSPCSLGRHPFLALGLCVSDVTLLANDCTGLRRIELNNQNQLRIFQKQLLFGLRHLATRARLPFRRVVARQLEIQGQIALVLKDHGPGGSEPGPAI